MTVRSATFEDLDRVDSNTTRSAPVALLPIIAVVFVAYLVIGIAMPVLPLHVHQDLGLGTFMVGLVSGIQFGAALVSRFWAGRRADAHGAKRAVTSGLAIASAAGLLYLGSLAFTREPAISVTVLLLGRAVLGVAESAIITGALSWGLARLGTQNTGRVMSWVGTALWGAFAAGAPAGSALYASHGFAAIAIATTVIPLATLALVARLDEVSAPTSARPEYGPVLRAVWRPGLALAFTGVGFAAITTFIALLYAQHGWSPIWLAFTTFSVAFMAGRLALGHLPDRRGGARVALACIVVEAAGLALIWLAPTASIALLGVTVTGLGYSLIYPALGVEALRSAPPQSRGLAMGAYTAFLDLAQGLAAPLLGLVAARAGLASVYLVSTIVVLASCVITLRIPRKGVVS
jgi:MFS family permease